MIALLVMTDGRDTIYQTIPSAEANLVGPISERWIHDDSGDRDHADKLRRIFPDYTVMTPSDFTRRGFAGAIRNAWQGLRLHCRAPYVFHLEDDFTFNRPVDLVDMVGILERHPHLVNLALRRQPWNAYEAAAGGIIEQHPDAYMEQRDDLAREPWLEHRLFFTTNPGLYHRTLIADDWPEGPESEGRFTHSLLQSDEDLRFGYYGAKASGEWVHHIGNSRAGIGY